MASSWEFQHLISYFLTLIKYMAITQFDFENLWSQFLFPFFFQNNKEEWKKVDNLNILSYYASRDSYHGISNSLMGVYCKYHEEYWGRHNETYL